jgi:hypothetical protein
MTVRIERRFTRGLSFLSSYAWSKSIDDGAGISTSSDSSGGAQNVRNLRAERAVSDFDVNHRWVMSFVYDLPFGSRYPSANRVANFLISGWQLTGIYTLQSGRPFTVTTGADRSGTGVTNTDRPNIIGDWKVSDPSPDNWFNACTLPAGGGPPRNCRPGESPAWQESASGTFGNAGRNLIRGDGLNNFDVGVSRFFRIKEGRQLQFRAEVFNLANHPNFFFPTASLASLSAGTVSRAANVGTGAQRQIQFAVKILF